MNDLLEQAREIAKAIVEETTDIDLILVYGSLARGTGGVFSDIDLLVISDKVSVSWSFVLTERPVSVHTMSWNQIIGLAKGIYGTWSTGASIFANHHVLWSKSKDSEKRFREISTHIPEGSKVVLKKATANFTSLYGELWRLQNAVNQNDNLTPSFLVWNIAVQISYMLSALNRKPMIHNWGKQLSELSEFEIAPDKFATRYTQLLTSHPRDALPIATNLIVDLEILVRQWFNDQKLSKSETIGMLEGEWSGIIDCLNKVYSAAQSEDLVATRYAAVEFAEFAIWLLRTIEGEQSDPKRFMKTSDELERLPLDSQKPLEILLLSMEIDNLVKASEQLANLLRLSFEKEGVKASIVQSISEGKEHLRISTV